MTKFDPVTIKDKAAYIRNLLFFIEDNIDNPDISNHAFLLESYTSSILESFGYHGQLQQDQKKRNEQLRSAHHKIRKLEEQLGGKASLEDAVYFTHQFEKQFREKLQDFGLAGLMKLAINGDHNITGSYSPRMDISSVHTMTSDEEKKDISARNRKQEAIAKSNFDWAQTGIQADECNIQAFVNVLTGIVPRLSIIDLRISHHNSKTGASPVIRDVNFIISFHNINLVR